jgi:ribose-phosphate pyrophosphokinase
VKIFSGSSNQPLAKKIASALGTILSPRELFIFPDGERHIQIQESVLDEDVIIVQSTSTPVDQNYLELFFLIDAAKRSGARSVKVVMPYVGYQRQDHVFRDGEAVSMQVIITTLESLGIECIIACDLHTIRIPELFHIPVFHLSALSLFAQTIKQEGWTQKDTVLITPDAGGIRRIEILSHLLGDMPYVTITKKRDLATGIIEAASFEGTIQKRSLIVDDMISSGGTIAKAAELLHKNGAEEIYVFATHPVFSAEAPKILQESLVKKVYVTDSVYVSEEKRFEKLEILTLASVIAGKLKDN